MHSNVASEPHTFNQSNQINSTDSPETPTSTLCSYHTPEKKTQSKIHKRYSTPIYAEKHSSRLPHLSNSTRCVYHQGSYELGSDAREKERAIVSQLSG
jgi:hypothetical protein